MSEQTFYDKTHQPTACVYTKAKMLDHSDSLMPQWLPRFVTVLDPTAATAWLILTQ